MTERTFYLSITGSEHDAPAGLLSLLGETGAAYCVIGGLAVNAYAEPVASLDLDLVVVADKLDTVVAAATACGMTCARFEHSINLAPPGTRLRIQLQTDPRYQEFVPRAEPHTVFGYEMMVAAMQDVLRGKVWAWSDEQRRPSKRSKDLSDILRLVETHPQLRSQLPPELAALIE